MRAEGFMSFSKVECDPINAPSYRSVAPPSVRRSTQHAARDALSRVYAWARHGARHNSAVKSSAGSGRLK